MKSADDICLDLRQGLNKGYPTTVIPKAAKPSHRKGVTSTKTKFVRSVIREVCGFSPYERRVLELLRNSKVSDLFLRAQIVTNWYFTGQEGEEVDKEEST